MLSTMHRPVEKAGTPHTVRLKPGVLHEAMRAAGIELASTLHRRMGVSRSGLDGVVVKGREPSAQFIGSMLAALGVKFDDLFEVVPQSRSEG